MDDQAAFIEEIRARPDDDLPRQIYADWLEERGDPLAELIRVQCVLDGLQESDPARTKLEQRARVLVANNYETWIEGPLILLGVHRAGFKRGLIEEVELDAALFLDQAAAIFQAAPLVRQVRLRKSAPVLGRLADSPHLARLTGLDLPGSILPSRRAGRPDVLGDEGMKVLAGSPHLTGLASLGLACNDIGPAGLRTVFEAACFRDLTSLDLSGNRIGAEGVRGLAAWPRLTQLTSLDLSHTGLTLAQFKLLGQSQFWNRKTLVTVDSDRFKRSERAELQYWFGVRVAP